MIGAVPPGLTDLPDRTQRFRHLSAMVRTVYPLRNLGGTTCQFASF